MDFYYRKLMGNGTVASKFRLNIANNPSDVRKDLRGDPENLPLVLETAVETNGTHHLSNCVRCYRLKKKCSRTYPKCAYCLKSGSLCDYVDRKAKRPKRESPDDAVLDPDQSLSVSIASLVNKDETEEHFRHIDLPSSEGVQQGDALPHKEESSRNLLADKRNDKRNGRDTKNGQNGRTSTFNTLNRRIITTAGSLATRQSLQDEFLVVRAILDTGLPSAFVHTFFANYEWKYPFLSMPQFVDKFRKILFDNETFVNLDVYLVMAVGCIIYDANNNTRHYDDIFSDNLIESIVDIISYDIRSEEDLHTAHLLILLCIYAVNVSNGNLVWNVVGFLNRLIIFLTDFSGKTNQCMRKRCFWSIFNLDKELSLLLHKPSQFIPTQIIALPSKFDDTLHDGEKEPLALLMEQAVTIHRMHDRMNLLKLGLVEKLPDTIVQFSSDLDKWRVAILLLVHKEYADLPLLPSFIGSINLDYYYLHIELDQLLETESFQFTLQFLSNSFSLLLTELSEKKGVVGTSLYSLFWFSKFFKVVDFNLDSLLRIVRADLPGPDLAVRLAEFNSNLQLILNLAKFLVNSRHKPDQFLEKLSGSVAKLTALNNKLLAFDLFMATKAQTAEFAAYVESTVA